MIKGRRGEFNYKKMVGWSTKTFTNSANRLSFHLLVYLILLSGKFNFVWYFGINKIDKKRMNAIKLKNDDLCSFFVKFVILVHRTQKFFN